ncbi:MAG TPA: HPr kinase/phosphatase C-terminal domain-containing protein [Allosphingosinicella sp.]|jgi:serine kinase of HPr protein (carbohydrate metabolism regulator)|nr:HPr kinase/phosphatase C-terminal domain-containing protein [Allosphingosinicella sp.]
MTASPDERVHASCVAIGGLAVLLAGPSGSGKSDLALRLIDRGARLVSDDYTELLRVGGRLVARAPATIAGRIELRGVGIIALETETDVPICLYADLAAAPPRLPEPEAMMLAGVGVPSIALAALEPSAPLKLEYALVRFGLPL